jgi:hypothetical protein
VRVLDRLRGQQGVQRRKPFRRRRVADADDLPQARHRVAQLADQAEERVVHEHHGHVGLVERVAHLFDVPPGVERHHHGVGPGDGQAGLEERVGVEGQQPDPVVGPDPAGPQPGGDPGHPVADLPVTQDPVAVDRVGGIGHLLDRVVQRLGEVHRGS